MGCWQCLSLTVVQLKGKHCQKPHCRNGVVDTFEPSLALGLPNKRLFYGRAMIRPFTVLYSLFQRRPSYLEFGSGGNVSIVESGQNWGTRLNCTPHSCPKFFWTNESVISDKDYFTLKAYNVKPWSKNCNKTPDFVSFISNQKRP